MAGPDEWERIKQECNISEVAAYFQYAISRRESSRNSVCMRHPNGSKIIIAKSAHDGHGIFFSVHRSAGGSVIDFVKMENNSDFKDAVAFLREFQGLPAEERPKQGTYAAKIEPSSRDVQAVLRAMLSMEAIAEHDYLVSRAVGKEITSDPRFTGRIYRDARGNVIFPHEGPGGSGITGYEIKNFHGFTGFSPHGQKGLWRSNFEPDDQRLVIAEAAIDALSYHLLNPHSKTRFVSAAGAWSDLTRQLLISAAQKLPGKGEIIMAFDNDPPGLAFEAEARTLLAGVLANTGKTLRTHYPAPGFKDWNDQAKAIMKQRQQESQPRPHSKDRGGWER